MRGWKYKIAIAIKEAGERWGIIALVRLGLNLRAKCLVSDKTNNCYWR
jgi:hypothetical protein